MAEKVITLANRLTIDNCFKDWNEIDPAIVPIMQSKDKSIICRLSPSIKKENLSKKLWGEYFLGQLYLDFTNLTKDDCIFFFLTLEDNMALKAPGVYRIVKGHLDL